MIKRPSRQLISGSSRSNLPMCVNTFDYNTQDTTDPSVPLPSSVNITVNAPAKLSFPSLGTSGFTSSSNSYGVTTSFPRLPFSVTNPVRMQFQALGTTGWVSIGSNPTRVEAASCTGVRVSRSSNSSSTVFDTPARNFQSGDLSTKFVDSGFYLRANSPYLFSVYGIFKDNDGPNSYYKLCFVYAPIKLLPQVFDLTALDFYVPDGPFTVYNSQTGGEIVGYGPVVTNVAERVGRFTCTTSPTLIDTDNIVEEVFSTYNAALSSTPPGSNGQFGVLLGVTSLAFTL